MQILCSEVSHSEVNNKVNCRSAICTSPLGSNSNPCAHEAAMALKYGIAGINFIPQRAEEQFNLENLAKDLRDLQLQTFVHLHQNQHAEIDMDKDYYSVPKDVDSLTPTPDDTCNIQLFNRE